jgi:hypothetical protein
MTEAVDDAGDGAGLDVGVVMLLVTRTPVCWQHNGGLSQLKRNCSRKPVWRLLAYVGDW